MRTIDREASALLMVDFQTRLMPAIEGGAAVIANARRLLTAARILGVPALFTEQNAGGLGATVPELAEAAAPVLHKMSFDACRAADADKLLPNRKAIVLAGCEAHVCVLQTALGLLDADRQVYVVEDAVGARRPESKTAALRRMAHHGAEIVTTEMVLFEWLATAKDPHFREVL
ncbi:MAG TPA: isochorismatase family protein, partial [Aliidongia sp.]|nr:isochorismatase family protein [Aliidongia sp.]